MSCIYILNDKFVIIKVITLKVNVSTSRLKQSVLKFIEFCTSHTFSVESEMVNTPSISI